MSEAKRCDVCEKYFPLSAVRYSLTDHHGMGPKRLVRTWDICSAACLTEAARIASLPSTQHDELGRSLLPDSQ